LPAIAIPTLFPAVEVSRPPANRGWYFDGGTRLNTPIKPALALGAERVVVVALNSIAGGAAVGGARHRPDLFEAAGQLLQALLVDPLVEDVRALAGVNQRLAGQATGEPARAVAGKRRVPYILVAPEKPDSVGRLAARVAMRTRHRETGREGEIEGLAIFSLEDGRIAEEWSSWDYLGLADQLGIRSGG